MDFPESELVVESFTIRELRLPPQVTLTKRSMIRWLALSLGLISPGESRASILDVMEALFFFQFNLKRSPTSKELWIHLKENKKEISDKLLRYHLKRLKDLSLIESKRLQYSFTASPYADKNDVTAGFKENYSKRINHAVEETGKVLSELKKKYEEK
ncbi:MAG: hypothetical protein JW703_01005 [Candidatus Diapherotrites archaeon]|nr:hypothetical protein [Candidatus Diapherotrites archaeon]